MKIRQMAVTRSSSVRTQAGGEGIVCGVKDVELLSWAMLLEADAPAFAEAGGGRGNSSGLGRCMRRTIATEVCRRGAGTHSVLAVGSEHLITRDWRVGGEDAVAASETASRGRSLILGGTEGRPEAKGSECGRYRSC